jgi:hypothetical protein
MKTYFNLNRVIINRITLIGYLILIPTFLVIAQSGVLRTTDYGTSPISGGAFFWRGYSFKLTQQTVVTHIIGGGQAASTGGFQGAIFSANIDGNGNATSPAAILRQVSLNGSTVNQEVAITHLTLEANTWYYIAQGDMGGSPTIYHWYVENLNVDDLISASYRIADWKPESTTGCHYWSAGNPATVVVGVAPNTSPNRPAVGMKYQSSATLPAVTTLATPMYGQLTDRGGAPTAIYIEYKKNSSDFTSGTTLNLSDFGYEGSVPYTYGTTAAGLDHSSTYYYRARAINDAGRVDGSIMSFTTPSPPGAPTITSIVPGNQQLIINFTGPSSGSADTYQYSTNNGSTWTSRMPASSESPLTIAGLTNGTSYSVLIRAVYQGIIGTQSNMVQGTPSLPNPTGITATFPSICSGSSTQLTASGAQGTVYWYTASCGGTSVTTGNPITVSPTGTTTYYARNYEGGNFSAGCAQITITVEPTPASGSLTKNPNVASLCQGSSVSATLSAGSGGNGVDELEYRTNNGSSWSSWIAYTSGSSISTNGLSNIEIRTRRTASTCSSAGYNTVTWSVNPLQQFRSKNVGNWTTPANWEQYNGSSWVAATTYPSEISNDCNNPQVTIQAGHQMEIQSGSNINIPNLEIEATGKLTVKSGGKIIVQNQLKLNQNAAGAIVVESK